MPYIAPEIQRKISLLPRQFQEAVYESRESIYTEDDLQRFLELLECQNRCCGGL